MSTPSPTPRRRWLLWTAAGLLLSLVLLLLVGGWLWSSLPAYWAPLAADDPAIQSNARRFETQLINTAHHKAKGDWSITITQDQMNQWLAARLPQWLANQNHPLAEQPMPKAMVAFFSDRLELAFDATPFGHDQVFRLVYTPVKQDEGDTTQLALTGLYGGRLPLPTATALNMVAENNGREVADTLAQFDLATQLADGRMIRVVNVQLHDGKIVLNCQTTHD
jgi:hypothetical protein